jgi:phosphoglycolate phosphatase
MLGKPSKTMWDVLVDQHGLDAKRSCMIGDRLDTDIAFAANCSLAFSLAVLSGVTNENEIMEYSKKLDFQNGNHENDAKLCPDYFINCLGDFEKLLKVEYY